MDTTNLMVGDLSLDRPHCASVTPTNLKLLLLLPLCLLGGPWDELIITGIITLLIIGVTPTSPFRGIISSVISPVISSY